MKFQKTIIFQLTKCYSLAPLQYHGESCFLVGAEKHDPSYLFHADGTVLAKVWDAPGGVMTMEQLPGTDGQFLSTQEFYSPNNGKNARIVIAVPTEDRWDVRTLVDIPLVHRFGILSRGGVNYLLVCTIKNDYSERDDWRQPGTVYAAVLPDDLSCFDAQHQLPLQPIMTGLWKNHGFSKYSDGGIQTALIGAQQGLFQFTPPAAPGESWNIRQLLDVPCSDAVMTDFDGDGLAEIGCMTPFHGDALQIFHKQADAPCDLALPSERPAGLGRRVPRRRPPDARTVL